MKSEKKILIAMLICSGCSKTELVKVPIPTNEPRLTTEYLNENLDASYKNNHNYEGDNVVSCDTFFFTEANPCITTEYIVVRIMMDNGEDFAVEIGSHCYDQLMQGGVVNMNKKAIEIGDDSLKVGDLSKLYYKFPDGFIPQSYLDYCDYAIKIEGLN